MNFAVSLFTNLSDRKTGKPDPFAFQIRFLAVSCVNRPDTIHRALSGK